MFLVDKRIPMVSYKNIIRWWLTGILILLPFQRKLVKSIVLWSNELSAFISYLDEITIVIFLPLVIREFYKNREIPNRLYLILLSPILVLSISGLIYSIVNGNSLFITPLSTFDYIKNFLVIFIYAVFFREFSEFKKTFRLLLIVAVFLGIIAFIQEFWAMTSRFILEKDVSDINYLLTKNLSPKDSWRFGIYRAPSLMHNSNMLGLYILLILTIYLCIEKKVNFAVLTSLFAGIFLSISRMVYMGFVFMAGVQIFRGRRWFIPLVVIPIVILLFSMSPLSKFDMTEGQQQRGFITYREYTRHKAIEVWKDHPFWGVGPGMFGGVVSIKTQSPVYDEYNFSKEAKTMVKSWKSLDQFWPQLLAEMGIMGTILFAGFFISLFITFFILRRWAASEEMRGLFTGLAAFVIVILIYSLGSGLNITSILFTYCAIAGMGLGCGGASHE